MQKRSYRKIGLEAGFVIGILVAVASTVGYSAKVGLDWSDLSTYLLGALAVDLLIFVGIGFIIGVSLDAFYKVSEGETKVKHISVRKKKK